MQNNVTDQDFIFKQRLEDKIDKQSKQIIRLMYGRLASDGYSNTWLTEQGKIIIDFFYRYDQQIEMNNFEYYNFDYKTYKANSRHIRKQTYDKLNKLRKARQQNRITKKLQDMINTNPDQAYKLLKTLTD